MTRAEIEAADRRRRREIADAAKIARYQMALEAIKACDYGVDKDKIARLALSEVPGPK